MDIRMQLAGTDLKTASNTTISGMGKLTEQSIFINLLSLVVSCCNIRAQQSN